MSIERDPVATRRFGTEYAGRWLILTLAVLALGTASPFAAAFRPPAVPLVACDPYFSIWSGADRLTDTDTTHWTRRSHRLTSLVRIDQRAYRLMGKDPASVPALEQTELEVLPLRTVCTFKGAGIWLKLTFLTPALPDDLMIYSRPVTYVIWDAQSTDGREHAVQVYFSASGEIAVNEPTQMVVGTASKAGGTATLKLGAKDQIPLTKRGDDLRIDWGYLYVASSQAFQAVVGETDAERQFFLQGVEPGQQRENTKPQERPAADLVAAMILDFGRVGPRVASKWLVLAYDDEWSIQYFKRNLKPFWRRSGDDATALIQKSITQYNLLRSRCEAFETELMMDLTKAGGEKYARLCALAYRQCVAGNKLVADGHGQPLLLPKENTSNGCIGTVDVIYPMSPQFLLFGASLTKAMLVPNLDYASSPRWKWPFAPHDLGTYPLANGQVYGGGERTEENQMPVEETGNMLILMAALAQMEGNADFAGKYWPTLTKWAEYLQEKGFDPENQLCTDDFLGHLAHNVNLSVKATLGVAAYGYLCELRGDKPAAAQYRKVAQGFATRWMKEADDGNHSRLAFDKPGTWSQKYNLVWDRILGFNLYPENIFRREMDHYLQVRNPYGVPLDSRGPGAKLDWSLWTATLTQKRADFLGVMEPVYRFLEETPQRVGAGDWYNTMNGYHIGMHSRPVVGGVFLQLLYDKAVWRKWAARDLSEASNWAPLPLPPKVTTLVPAADQKPATWRYTTAPPPDGWNKPGFDDSSWSTGTSGFGTAETPGAIAGTKWESPGIWLRREVTFPREKWEELQCWMHHDEDVEVYANGTLILKASGYTTGYETFPLLPAAKKAITPGVNFIAVYCRQTSGGQYVDLGFVEVKAP